MMADSVVLDYNKIGKSTNDFSFTKQLAKIALNDEWVEGYNTFINNETPNNYSELWKVIFTSTEDVGNQLYSSIKNYINDISNIDKNDISIEKINDLSQIRNKIRTDSVNKYNVDNLSNLEYKEEPLLIYLYCD